MPPYKFGSTEYITSTSGAADASSTKSLIFEGRYQPLQGNEFGSWGSAMIAGKAAGVFDDLVTVASEHARPASAPLSPDPDNHAAYQPLVAQHIHCQSMLSRAFVQYRN